MKTVFRFTEPIMNRRLIRILIPVIVLKVFFQAAVMVLLAVLVMLILYPALHEAGHAITAVIVGARVTGIEVFPVAHTDIDAGQCSRAELIAVAMSGGIAPLLVLLCLPRRFYYVYYVALTVALISASSALTSLIYVWQFFSGTENAYDDAVGVLSRYPDARYIVLAILAVQLSASLMYCFLSKPLDRMTAVFTKPVAA